MKKILLFCLFLIFSLNLYTESTLDEQANTFALNEPKSNLPVPVKNESSDKVILSTIKEAIYRAIENSPSIKNIKYELVKVDSTAMKNQPRYSWKIIGGMDSNKQKLPWNQNNILSGTKIQNDKFSAGIEKMFDTATYLKLEGSSTRFDANNFETTDPVPPALGAFGAFGLKPLYTGAITGTLSQELLKNGFGYQSKNTERILDIQTEIAKEELSFNIANLIISTMVEYWNYTVLNESMHTTQRMLENVVGIRDLTQKKLAIGLAENFELNQWNAFIAQTESQLEKARLDKDSSKQKLIRLLNLPDNAEIDSLKDMALDKPNMTLDKDLEYAYLHRSDWKNIQRKKEIAELAFKNAKNDALPQLSVGGYYGWKGQNLTSPQDNFTGTNNGIPSFKYMDGTAQVKVVYPIGDKGVKAGLRDTTIQIKQLSILEEDLKKEIKDDLANKLESVEVSHKVLENAMKAQKENDGYYHGLSRSFKQGRFTAIQVKNSLDALIQSELQLTQAKVNFNISLLRYELAKNSLLKKYDINIDRLVPEIN